MRAYFLLGLVTLTTLGFYGYGSRTKRLTLREFVPAWRRTLECLGWGVIFFGFNVAVGFAGVLLLRWALGTFVSLYEINDIAILQLSLFQGAVFRLWWRNSA